MSPNKCMPPAPALVRPRSGRSCLRSWLFAESGTACTASSCASGTVCKLTHPDTLFCRCLTVLCGVRVCIAEVCLDCLFVLLMMLKPFSIFIHSSTLARTGMIMMMI